MNVGFSIVYGMSSPTEGIGPGERFAVYREQETIIGFTGQDDIVFWFVFENLHQKIPFSQAPRYTQADAEALCQTVAHVRVTPALKFGSLFENLVIAIKIAVEESVAKAWHTDRAVTVGDAACKTTPAGGQGANQAIESCAVLVNKLIEARWACPSGERLPREAIRFALTGYTRARAPSAAMILERSQMVCSALLCVPGPAAVLVKDMLKLSDEDWLLRAFMALSTAPVLEHVEFTERGHRYNDAVKGAKAGMERRQIAASMETRVEEKKMVERPICLVQVASRAVEVS